MFYLFAGVAAFIIIDMVRGYSTAKNKRNYLIKNSAVILGIIALLFLVGPLFIISPIKIGYSTLKEGDISLFYPKDRIDFANDILTKVKRADSENKDFYGITFPISVLIATSELDMLRFGSYPYAGGAGTELGITLREGKATTNVIAHEMSHRNLAELTGKPIPAPNWFNEGLASYIGKMDYYKKPQDLKDDLQNNRYEKDILKMRGVLGTLQWLIKIQQGKSKMLYGQTYLMVKYLFDTYGKDKVYDFITSLKDYDFEKNFIRVFGVSEEQFHQKFMDQLVSAHLQN